MSLKGLMDPACSALARACEASSTAARLIRSVDFKGKGRIVQKIRSASMAREVTAACRGVLYRLDLGDDVQREVYFNVYETLDLRQALDLIPVGGTCIDVGANIGAFALQFAKKVGKQGTVHALEPDPDVYARLETNCRLNGFEAFLKCHRVAVSNVSGSLSFHRSDRSHSGWGSLVEFQDIAVQSRAVTAVTLDSFLAQQGIGRVDFLKIDVEAHEPELLEGARQSLAGQAFQFILIEFNGIRLAQRGKSLEDILTPLATAGYTPTGSRLGLLYKMQHRQIAPESVVTNLLFAAPNMVAPT